MLLWYTFAKFIFLECQASVFREFIVKRLLVRTVRWAGIPAGNTARLPALTQGGMSRLPKRSAPCHLNKLLFGALIPDKRDDRIRLPRKSVARPTIGRSEVKILDDLPLRYFPDRASLFISLVGGSCRHTNRPAGKRSRPVHHKQFVQNVWYALIMQFAASASAPYR